MTAKSAPDPASFRDPAGKVYLSGDRVLRAVSSQGLENFRQVWRSGYLQELVDRHVLVDAWETDIPPDLAAGSVLCLEHPRLSFISYPYEWTFGGLKTAACFHLDLQIDALSRNYALSDATAYNVQFVGGSPIFIDHLSFRPYLDGEIWSAHTQFIEQFLTPLLLRSEFGIPHNDWYRAAIEGIPTGQIDALLPRLRRLSPNLLRHVVLPSYFQKRLSCGDRSTLAAVASAKLPRSAYQASLRGLRRWIASLKPKVGRETTWESYETNRSYRADELARKGKFLIEFTSSCRPNVLLDFGCNAGEYAQLALKSGARSVVGFDHDQGALDRAFELSRSQCLNFLPLYLDAANPTPAQGWAGLERRSLSDRARADALFALAFVHHLVIGRYIPLAEVVRWLLSLAPKGVLEFVPLEDPTVVTMRALRDRNITEYSSDDFLRLVGQGARVVKTDVISDFGRMLVWYER